MRKWKQRDLRRLGAALAVVLLLCVPVAQVLGAEPALPAAPARSQTVRVWLTRLNIEDRMDLTLSSPYSADTQTGSSLYFPAGSQLAVLLRQGQIYVYYQNMSVHAGESFVLSRAEEGPSGETGFRLANSEALYMGDLRLTVLEGKLRPVLSLHVEDYLLGVVPYEMSESFPLEALKAQAVAARTYALRKQNAARDYDLVDTTNDQVYKGYWPGNSQTEQAVSSTRGVCGFYQGALAQCYYSASNGGQTEKTGSVWPSGEDLPYYAFGEDPYDAANPASLVQRFDVLKEYASQAPYALRKLLAEELAGKLLALGYDPSPESVQVDKVLSLSVDTPDREGSKHMTRMKLSVLLSGRIRREIPADTTAEEVSLQWETQAETAAPHPESTVSASPLPSATPESTPQVVYGAFEAISEPFQLDVAIFPTLENALSLNLSGNYENELWSVVEKADRYVVEARRYGHGAGMSQRGAQWMAGMYGKTYQDILAFYYPGMELMQYPKQPVAFAQTDENLAQSPGPAPTATPRPTLMPLSLNPTEGQWCAMVTEIAADSSLNLRQQPNLNAPILTRLYKNQRLLVLERCPEDGWVRVCTDSIEGYVLEKYLTKD